MRCTAEIRSNNTKTIQMRNNKWADTKGGKTIAPLRARDRTFSMYQRTHSTESTKGVDHILRYEFGGGVHGDGL
jgi:hypothetical protein